MTTMKRIAIAALLLFSYTSFAQEKQFTSPAEATKFIHDLCNKYWLVNTKDGDISREITVYQQGCQLFFNEKSVFKTKGAAEGMTTMNNTLVSVNLRKVKQSGNYASLEFTGGKKDVITLITHDLTDIQPKPQYTNRYRVGLDYTNQMLKNNLYDLSTAANYLIDECHGKHTKHTRKKVVRKKK